MKNVIMQIRNRNFNGKNYLKSLTILCMAVMTLFCAFTPVCAEHIVEDPVTGSYLVDEEGNVYPVEVTLVDTGTNSQTGECSLTYQYDILLPGHMSQPVNLNGGTQNNLNNLTINDGDYYGTMRGWLTINYSTSGSSYLLYSVKPSWTIFDSSVSVVSRYMIYGCSNMYVTQVDSVYPYSGITYNTGFTTYVPYDIDVELGATLYLTLQSGGSQWDFVLDNRLFRSSLSIGGRW